VASCDENIYDIVSGIGGGDSYLGSNIGF